MIIFVDIDETICSRSNIDDDYNTAIPNKERIDKINDMHKNGHTIVYWTARGSVTQINWFQTTIKQLDEWGCKYHELRMGKPQYDLFIDDKNIKSDTFFGET